MVNKGLFVEEGQGNNNHAEEKGWPDVFNLSIRKMRPFVYEELWCFEEATGVGVVISLTTHYCTAL
jgi:hypothetical protein